VGGVSRKSRTRSLNRPPSALKFHADNAEWSNSDRLDSKTFLAPNATSTGCARIRRVVPRSSGVGSARRKPWPNSGRRAGRGRCPCVSARRLRGSPGSSPGYRFRQRGTIGECPSQDALFAGPGCLFHDNDGASVGTACPMPRPDDRINAGDREKDTERAAMTRQIVERFVLGHRRAPLDSCQDDGLGDLRQRRCLARGRGRCHGGGAPGTTPADAGAVEGPCHLGRSAVNPGSPVCGPTLVSWRRARSVN
jgi:hypothetical protein